MKIRKQPFFTVSALFCALIFLFPLIWMLFASLKPEDQFPDNPLKWFLPPFTADNILTIITNPKVARWILNSFLIGIVSTALTLAVSAPAAFALAQFSFPGAKIYYTLVLAGLMIPTEAMIIPLFSLTKNLGLLDSLAAVVLPSVAMPLAVIILRAFFCKIPKEIFESATVDGASPFRIFVQIALPLTKSALVSVTVFTLLTSWNNFLWPYIVLFSEELFTLPLGIPSFNNAYSPTYILPMTVNLVASLPILIIFIFFERHIIKGFSMSGIKG